MNASSYHHSCHSQRRKTVTSCDVDIVQQEEVVWDYLSSYCLHHLFQNLIPYACIIYCIIHVSYTLALCMQCVNVVCNLPGTGMCYTMLYTTLFSCHCDRSSNKQRNSVMYMFITHLSVYAHMEKMCVYIL